MAKILQCPKCGKYTMDSSCSKCKKDTVTVEPAKYKADDKYAKYRRMKKE
ncbi:MAG: nucleolar RNA-binding Nop10p family protein [Candidatus Undinarchaeales archaeon]|jgi:rRNA maturation protein Nop10|nr:nucleolar RNA-binding Nop10p family protein [Candidatus Undinarchaeales archaeon]